MKNLSYVLLLLSLMYLTSCGTSQEITATWLNKERKSTNPTYQKVFIAVLTANMEAKTVLENDLSQAATAHGITNLKSTDIFPPNMKNVDTTMLIQKIKEKGCDAIFTVAMINSKSETRYVPGTTTTSYTPSYGYSNGGTYYNGGYGSYNGYGGYYANPYVYYNYMETTTTTEGYYTTDETYFLEGNLFDAATNELLYSVQSKVFNPSDVATESAVYTKMVLDRMEHDGLIKPVVKPAK